jgi:hypothetical protein
MRRQVSKTGRVEHTAPNPLEIVAGDAGGEISALAFMIPADAD